MKKYKNKILDEIDIGEIIKTQRKKLKLTQLELAEQIGISYQLLQKYEYNKCKPPFDRLLDIFRKLDVDINVKEHNKFEFKNT